ncbi:TadE/TadG family type IV pilus assembly protein [Celeribacter halophilus]|uniref:TadE/TadG family type IV pilus assembly protein n=1 Tax=Celeribacter halophilus TaxID=576117 RepID=UPI002FCF0A3C
MSVFSKLRGLSRRHAKDDDGNATVEFVIVFPLFVALVFGGFEVGYYNVINTMLNRGLDLAVRDVRLGNMAEVTLDTLKTATCDYAKYVNDCEDNIHIALEPIDANDFEYPDSLAECIDRSEDVVPSTTFNAGSENELMLVRACVLVDPFFPTSWLGAALEETPGSGYAMVATAGFVNEPNS